MLSTLFAASAVVLFVGYRLYGRYLERTLEIDNDRATPATTMRDGRDFEPARAAVLFGHHFSSIAGAGPIVGPIIAAAAFGWLPAVLWVVIGSIFVGGVQDYSSLVASIRHKARSVGELAREHMSPLAHKLMLTFIWLALVYVLVVFLDLTATTFVKDASVASSSVMYIIAAIGFGLLLRKGVGIVPLTLIFVPLVFLGIAGGHALPLSLGIEDATAARRTWSLVLLAYCMIASIVPVWLLLQPRDYLSAFLLFACLVGGGLGVLVGGSVGDLNVQYPAFLSFRSESLGLLFPALFVTIACGACSGFHSIVASGTTAKQLACERDAKPVAYGSMLTEAVLALISISAVAVLAPGGPVGNPVAAFAGGMGKFVGVFGVPSEIGVSFGLLAVSTFLLTTLDTCTRLGRYVLDELAGLSGRLGAINGGVVATLVTLLLPLIFTQVTLTDAAGNPVPAWKQIWPVFGATNQMLGGLAMMVVTVWLQRSGKPFLFIAIPAGLMLTVTLVALVQLVFVVQGLNVAVRGIAVVLLVLAVVLLVDAARSLLAGPQPDAAEAGV